MRITHFRPAACPGGLAAEELRLLKQIISKTRSECEAENLSEKLLRRHGRLMGVLRASQAGCCDIAALGADIDHEIKAIADLLTAVMRVDVSDRCVIDNPDAVISYCRLHLAAETREQFHVLYLAKNYRLIEHACLQIGTVDHVTVYPREVMARALAVAATSLILVHNHPSGNPNPSSGDRRMTRELVRACGYLGIHILDHIVIADAGSFSFRQQGLLGDFVGR